MRGEGEAAVRTRNTHFLNTFFIDTHFGVNLFKYFAQGKGKKPDGSQTQLVAHFIQDLAGFLAEGVLGLQGLHGELEGREAEMRFWEKEPRLFHSHWVDTGQH